MDFGLWDFRLGLDDDGDDDDDGNKDDYGNTDDDSVENVGGNEDDVGGNDDDNSDDDDSNDYEHEDSINTDTPPQLSKGKTFVFLRCPKMVLW